MKNTCILLLLVTTAWTQSVDQFRDPHLRQLILHQHNMYRSAWLPYPASNMMELRWDNKLAQEAANWARTCQFQHYTPWYGQNLYRDVNRGYGPDQQLILRFMRGFGDNEKKYMVPMAQQRGQNRWNNDVGRGIYEHYSQTIWHNTEAVGCAVSNCPGKERIVVCNYWPAGNVKGDGWYNIGNSCSKCPPGTFCRNRLCAYRNQ